MQEVEIFRTIPERARVSKTGLRNQKEILFRYPPVTSFQRTSRPLAFSRKHFPPKKNLIKAQKKEKKNNGGKEKQKHQEGEKEGEEVSLF